MKISKVIFLTIASLSLMMLFSVTASAATVDFEVQGISQASCFQPETLVNTNTDIDSHNADNFITKNNTDYIFIGDLNHDYIYEMEKNNTTEVINGSSTYRLLDKAQDMSWYRVILETTDPSLGKIIIKTRCYKTSIEGNGTMAVLVSPSDDFPTSMSSFFDMLFGRLPVSTSLLADDIQKYDKKSVLSTISYVAGGNGTWLVPEIVLNAGEADIYGSASLYESTFEPGDAFNLVFSINNTFNYNTKMYDRTWFNDKVKHYNEGPTVFEDNMDNNYYKYDNFLTSGTDYPASPVIKNFVINGNNVSFDWNSVPLADSYQVVKLKDDLNVIEFDFETDRFNQTNTSFTGTVDTDSSIIDCFYVKAISADGVHGPASAQVCSGSYFTDVDPVNWYAEYTNKAVGRGYLSGYQDEQGNYLGTFGPGNEITKAEALKITGELTDRYVQAQMFGFTLPYTIPAHLNDHWAYDYIWGSYIVGIDLVDDINNFDPNQNITRGELIHLLAQSLEAKLPTTVTNSFDDTVGHVYEKDIALFRQLGIISGYGGTNDFGPDNNLKRSEAAKIFIETANKFMLSWPRQ